MLSFPLIENPTASYFFDGTSTCPIPALSTGAKAIFLTIRSDGGNSSAPIISFSTGFSVELTDGFAIILRYNSFYARFVGGAALPIGRVYQLAIQMQGTNLKDFSIYANGFKMLFDLTGSLDGDISAFTTFPCTATLPGFAGLKREFYIESTRVDEYSKPDINRAEVGWVLGSPSDTGLYDLVSTNTGSFSIYSKVVSKKINRFPFLLNHALYFESKISPRATLCNGINPDSYSAELSANYSIVRFKLSRNGGSLILKTACNNGYEDTQSIIPFTTAAELVDLFSADGWQLTYSSIEDEYELRYFGGAAPDFGQACSQCSVPHLPIFFTLSSDTENINVVPPKNLDNFYCGGCDYQYSCYFFMAFVSTCVTITRPYGCINDTIKEVRVFTNTQNVLLGNQSFLLNGVFDGVCEKRKDVLFFRWFNDNQLPRLFGIYGAIYDKKYKSTNEVSTSSKGIVRKLYNRTFTSYTIFSDFYTYDVIDFLQQILHADNVQILINGIWKSFTLEEGIEAEDEPSNVPIRAKISAKLTEKKFTILNDFV